MSLTHPDAKILFTQFTVSAALLISEHGMTNLALMYNVKKQGPVQELPMSPK